MVPALSAGHVRPQRASGTAGGGGGCARQAVTLVEDAGCKIGARSVLAALVVLVANTLLHLHNAAMVRHASAPHVRSTASVRMRVPLQQILLLAHLLRAERRGSACEKSARVSVRGGISAHRPLISGSFRISWTDGRRLWPPRARLVSAQHGWGRGLQRTGLGSSRCNRRFSMSALYRFSGGRCGKQSFFCAGTQTQAGPIRRNRHASHRVVVC
jgi:hypothetical protein